MRERNQYRKGTERGKREESAGTGKERKNEKKGVERRH